MEGQQEFQLLSLLWIAFKSNIPTYLNLSKPMEKEMLKILSKHFVSMIITDNNIKQ